MNTCQLPSKIWETQVIIAEYSEREKHFPNFTSDIHVESLMTLILLKIDARLTCLCGAAVKTMIALKSFLLYWKQ